MEQYGFVMNMTGDAVKKLQELGVEFTKVEGKAKSAADGSEGFGKMFASMSLGGIASQGIEKLFGGIKEEIMDSEKAAIDYEKSLTLMRLSTERTSEAGDGAFESMKMLAESSKLYSPGKMIEAEKQLQDVGNLNEQQIKAILPLIGDYAATSKQFSGDVVAASTAVGTAMQTGMMRPLKDLRGSFNQLHLELKKGDDPIKNYEKLLQVLQTRAGGTSEYLGTMAGQLDAMTAKKEKIQEESGSGFFTQMGAAISLGFTEMFHAQSTQIVEGKEEIDNAMKMKSAFDPKGETANNALKVYMDQLQVYKKAAQVVMDTQGKAHAEAVHEEDTQMKLLKYANDRYQELLKVKNVSADIKKIDEEDADNYSKLSKDAQILAGKLRDEYLNKKIDKNDVKKYKDEMKKTMAADAYIASLTATGNGLKQSALNTSALGGASGGLGQAKVINIAIDTVQKIIENAGADGTAIKKNADNAIPIIIRTINNITYSQSGVM